MPDIRELQVGVLARLLEHLRDGCGDVRLGPLAYGDRRCPFGRWMLCQRVGDELGQQARCQRDAPEPGVRPSAEPSSGMPSVDEAGFMDYEVDAVGRTVGVVRSNLLVTYTIMLAIE